MSQINGLQTEAASIQPPSKFLEHFAKSTGVVFCYPLRISGASVIVVSIASLSALVGIVSHPR
jgi:hypothetical protein